MIEEILSRQYVLGELKKHLDRVKVRGLESRRRGDEAPEGSHELSHRDYVEAHAAMEQSLAADEQKSSGQPGFDDITTAGRPGADSGSTDAAPPIDDLSFFSRDPVISNFQSALEAYLEDRQPDAIDAGRRGATASAVTERSLIGVDDGGRRLLEQFSITDPRWIDSLIAMGITKFRGKHDFVPNLDHRHPIDDRCRMLMVGDWGSGLDRAQMVSDQMRTFLDHGKVDGLQQHVVHLGGVYYSGWEREVKKRFLKYWPIFQSEAGEITSWSANANHDMYSGGFGYYDTLLGDERFKNQRGSSIFVMANSHWRILGLDTAWDDHGLKAPQPDWVKNQVAEAKQAGQKVMLLSHHQPFSAYEDNDGAEKLVDALAPVLNQDPPLIDAWFWGHEHRCVVYDTQMGIRFPSCVGHGGIPVYQKHDAGDPLPGGVKWEYRGRFKEGHVQWAKFGFAVLDLDGPSIRIRYVDEDGMIGRDEVID